MLREIKIIYYQLKGISLFVWLPFIVLYVVLPISHVRLYHICGNPIIVYYSIIEDMEFIVPLLSVWYVIFVLHHLVEQKGYELLYLEDKIKWKEMLLVYALFAVMLFVVFWGYTYFFPQLWLLYLKLLVVDLVYTCFTYASTYVTRKIILAIVCVLLYTSLSMFGNSDIFGLILYTNTEVCWDKIYCGQLLVYLFVSIIFAVIGVYANHRFAK